MLSECVSPITDFGGALFIGVAASLSLARTTVIRNSGYGGGGAYITDATARFTDSTWLDNRAPDNRGGAVCVFGSAVTFAGTTRISGNTAFFGGAVYADASTLNITGSSSWSHNTASSSGGALYEDGYGTVTVGGTSCFTSNVAEGFYGGAWYLGSASTVNVLGTGVTFGNNTAGDSGPDIYSPTSWVPATLLCDGGNARGGGGYSITG